MRISDWSSDVCSSDLIAHATANGIVVVAPVGNGHLAFPGMHTDVICAGGVYIDRCSKPIASDYCSAYQDPWYENRWCPDLCGLSGLHPAAAYIMSPVPTGSQLDRDACARKSTRLTSRH